MRYTRTIWILWVLVVLFGIGNIPAQTTAEDRNHGEQCIFTNRGALWRSAPDGLDLLRETAPRVFGGLKNYGTIGALGSTPMDSISYTGTTYSQNFDSLASSGSGVAWTNDTTIPGWFLYAQPAPGTAITTYNADSGTSSAGSFYSFGSSGSGERALGGLGTGGTYFGSPSSGSIAGWIAFSATNDTGATINDVTIAFDGEQWRKSGDTVAHSMVFEYGIGGTFGAVSIWTAPGGNFDWASPVFTAGGAAVNGNTAGKVAGRGGTISSLGWDNGETLWIRWVERNDAGSDHSLAIDEFSLSSPAVPTPTPSPSPSPSSPTPSPSPTPTATPTPTPPPVTCLTPDNGLGTADLPTCRHLGGPMEISAGLPPSTRLLSAASLDTYRDIVRTPGGPLGGETDTAKATLRLEMNGTGTQAGFRRLLELTVDDYVTYLGPRTPGNPVQSFDTEMFRLQGQLPAGDPDFDLLRVTAGSAFGMPSPGHTTLTRVGGPGTPWMVDSFFDITYRIDFVGKPGGPLGGMSGSTTATIRWHQVRGPVAPTACEPLDNGGGTADLPALCPYTGWPKSVIDGLPEGTTLQSDAFFDVFTGIVRSPGGTLGGEVEQFGSTLTLEVAGTGNLSGYHRTIPMLNVQVEVHTAPRTPGTPVQSFDTDMFGMQGQLPAGDPDFDLLRVTAGSAFGMPSPGHTTLTQLPGGHWNVDSFFDIEYRIDFIGHPGGPFGGMSGSTTATIRMQQGTPFVLPSPTPTPTPVADLVVTKTDSADPVVEGSQFTYTIRVQNNGPDTATNVTVSDPLPLLSSFFD
ncbi:MAG: DUF11 domain-containing protein, partial [Pyrinomonadaceae bacterium]|nr:DUF11 domain-containing protein [Pyrinomonadaceae bacterium]